MTGPIATSMPPSRASMRPNNLDYEPDDEWKRKLREEITKNLTSMVDDARKQKHDMLEDPSLTEGAHESINKDYSHTMDSIRRLAESQFQIALERERQERRWAAGQQLDQIWSEVMIKEQCGILETIEKEKRVKGKQPDWGGPASADIYVGGRRDGTTSRAGTTTVGSYRDTGDRVLDRSDTATPAGVSPAARFFPRTKTPLPTETAPTPTAPIPIPSSSTSRINHRPRNISISMAKTAESWETRYSQPTPPDARMRVRPTTPGPMPYKPGIVSRASDAAFRHERQVSQSDWDKEREMRAKENQEQGDLGTSANDRTRRPSISTRTGTGTSYSRASPVAYMSDKSYTRPQTPLVSSAKREYTIVPQRSHSVAPESVKHRRFGSIDRSNTPIPEIWMPSITPEQDAAMSRGFSWGHRGSPASAASSMSFSRPSPLSQSASQQKIDPSRVKTDANSRGSPQVALPAYYPGRAGSGGFRVHMEESDEDNDDDEDELDEWLDSDLDEVKKRRGKEYLRRQREMEFRRLEEEARRKEEEVRRKEEDGRRREEEAKRKEDMLRRKEEEFNRREQEARRWAKENLKMQEDFRRREEEIRRKEEEVMMREAAIKQHLEMRGNGMA